MGNEICLIKTFFQISSHLHKLQIPLNDSLMIKTKRCTRLAVAE